MISNNTGIGFMSFIANRLNHFDSSDFRKAIERQQDLVNPIDLSVGLPEELTAKHIKNAGIKAIKDNHTKYTPSNGIPELRAAIAKKNLQDNKLIHHHPDNVTIVPGLTTGQLLVYLATLDPGDEVIVFDPFYPPYTSVANMVGAHVVYSPTLPDFQPNLSLVEASITNRTKMIIVNSPNNPSGAVYPEATLRKIAKIAEEHNLLVVSDEIYENFVYGDKKHFSIGSIYPNTLTMNGFSKEFAMTGWRVGYISGPRDIIDAINELQQYTIMSSSSIAQYAALAAMSKRVPLNGKYLKKREFVISELNKLGLDVHGADGAYYIFFKSPNGLTDLEFVNLASEHNLILVPGRAFSRRSGYVRLSYGADMKSVKKGIEILKVILEELS